MRLQVVRSCLSSSSELSLIPSIPHQIFQPWDSRRCLFAFSLLDPYMQIVCIVTRRLFSLQSMDPSFPRNSLFSFHWFRMLSIWEFVPRRLLRATSILSEGIQGFPPAASCNRPSPSSLLSLCDMLQLDEALWLFHHSFYHMVSDSKALETLRCVLFLLLPCDCGSGRQN